MPRKSKLKLPPINLGDETFGQRLARLRKEKGYTQAELASKMGLVQALVSEYERDKLRLHHEMVARFALALEVSADVLLGLNAPKRKHKSPSLRLQKRMIQIEALPAHQQIMPAPLLEQHRNGWAGLLNQIGCGCRQRKTCPSRSGARLPGRNFSEDWST